MSKHVYSAIGTLITCVLIYWMWHYNDQTKRFNVRYNHATVVGIGQCSESKCSFTYKTEFGTVSTGISSEPVSIGQSVYQQCWTEKGRGDRCYTEYKPK